MKSKIEPISEGWDPEPRWHALIAVIAVGGLYTALPSSLIVGPRLLFLVVVVVLLVPTVVSHIRNNHRLNQIPGFTVNGVVTLGMIGSVVLLISALPEPQTNSNSVAGFRRLALVYKHFRLCIVVLAARCGWSAQARKD